MNKKGVAVPAVLITRVLGGVIVLFILWMIVSPFASTLLNYMNLAKNVESFNKFTTAYSRACTSGNSLMTDFTLTSAGHKHSIFSILFINPSVANKIRNIDICEAEKKDPRECPLCYEMSPCTDQDSITSLAPCYGGCCVCLLRLDYRVKEKVNEESYHCLKLKDTVRGSAYIGAIESDEVGDWFNHLDNFVTHDNALAGLKVYQCKALDDLKCTDPKTGPILLTGSTRGGSNYLVGITPEIKITPVYELNRGYRYSFEVFPVKIETMVFVRPISTIEGKEVLGGKIYYTEKVYRGWEDYTGFMYSDAIYGKCEI